MKRFKNILCVVTPEASCWPALERVVSLAENNQARLTDGVSVLLSVTGRAMLLAALGQRYFA